MKLRKKYTEAKVSTGGQYSPRTGHSRTPSLHRALHEDWVSKEPGKSLHRADELRQAAMPKKSLIIPVVGRRHFA